MRFRSVVVTGAVVWASLASSAVGEGLTLRDLPGSITEGVLIVNAPPAVVYAHATDYANWSRQFSDIRAVTWESGDRDHARVRFRSIAFDRSITVQFDNIPGRLIRFHAVKTPPGGRASGAYTLIPVDGGARTKVVARLYMDVVGASRLLLSEDTIRTQRRAKLEVDLRDTERWFDALAGG